MSSPPFSIARFPRHFAVSLLVVGFVAACTADHAPAPEPLASQSSAVLVNGGFESGAANMPPPSWTVTTNINDSITVQTPQTLAGLDLMTGGAALTDTLFSATGPNTQTDTDLGATATLRWPKYGNDCALVNNHSSTTFGHGQNVNTMAQTMTIGTGDVDPNDGLVHVRFVVAPVLQNPSHAANQQPYYFVQLNDVTQSTILYSDFNLSGQAGVPWQTINGGTANEIDYTDWQLVDISPVAGSLAMGDQVSLQIIASGCSPGGHFGKIYVDGGVGPTLPGLFVTGTGPSQANACSDITYTLTYENGGTTPAAGVVVTFNTPPNTTFQALNAPGLTCTTPAVNSAGTVTCTVGAVAAGASGHFTVEVNIACGTTGTIVEGDYSIQGTANPPLLGSHVVTTVGCTLDAQCPSGQWCDVSASDCTPTLANGVAIPTDTGHMNPALTGACTQPAGALVCTSHVCDTTNNECGYANGDGPCTASPSSAVCQSGVCDPDLHCGYAVGDGPCTVGDQSTVCRSGACSTNGTCEPSGGCDVDADCAGNRWCDESVHTCTARLANGVRIPTDMPHMNPTLDGTCTAGAGALVCVSLVCDTHDNDCGYANGDGPCTSGTAMTVCRSGACSMNGTCEPSGGCNEDADCASGTWCDEIVHTCTARLANGIAIPTDAPHTNPTLNGTCTAAAGALVCVSLVCDTHDNECGFAVGDGPCTGVTATVVCRSAACSTNGTCEPPGGCNVDADCAGGTWCDESVHTCTARLANGVALPVDAPHTSPTLNGACTPAAGALVCASLVCDTHDNKCGLSNGDGPCTAQTGPTVCRSGSCSANGTCEPMGGCNEDADCAAGHWCNETANTCTAQSANGVVVATDPAHTNPTLDGTCTVAAGALVCTSLVCDTHDNECGYANGDGPCTAQTGATVCRSGACSANGTCEPTGGCNVNADCTEPAVPVCNTTTHTCEAAPDAGVDGGTPDAGAHDSGLTLDSSADAEPDAEADAAPDAADYGYVEGSGLSCAVSRAPSGPPGALAGLMASVAIALGARRRRQARAR